MHSNFDPVQQHTASVVNLISTFQSMQNVRLSSVMDYNHLKFCHIPTSHGQGSFQVKSDQHVVQLDPDAKIEPQQEVSRGWGSAIWETVFGSWRIRRDELEAIKAVFDKTIEDVQKDALKKNIKEWDLKALNAAVASLENAVENASEGLTKLQGEFEQDAQLHTWKTSQSSPIKFAKFINDFITQTREKATFAHDLLDQRLKQLEFHKSQSANSLASSSLLLAPPSPPSGSTTPAIPSPASSSPDLQQVQEAALQAPLLNTYSSSSSAAAAAAAAASPDQVPANAAAVAPASFSAEEQPSAALPSLVAASLEPIAAPVQAKGPDLDHYHHPYFRGHSAFGLSPDYAVKAQEQAQASGKKQILASQDAIAKANFMSKLRKGALESEASEIYARFRQTQKAYDSADKIVAKKPLPPVSASSAEESPAAAAATSLALPPPPPPPPKAAPKPPAPPAFKPKGKAAPKPAGENAAEETSIRDLNANSKKILQALEAEAAYNQAKAELITLLFPEYAGNASLKFSNEDFEKAYNVFLNDLRTLQASEKLHPAAGASALSSKLKPENDMDPYKQKAIAPVAKLIQELTRILDQINDLEKQIKKNDNAVKNLIRDINSKSGQILSADADKIEGMKKELLQLRQQLETAQKIATDNKPMIEAKIMQLRSESKKPVKLLGLQINQEIANPQDLIKAARAYIQGIEDGTISPNPAKKTAVQRTVDSKPLPSGAASSPRPKAPARKLPAPAAARPMEQNDAIDPFLSQSMFLSRSPDPETVDSSTRSFINSIRSKKNEDQHASLLSSQLLARRERLQSSVDEDDGFSDSDDEFRPMSSPASAAAAAAAAAVLPASSSAPKQSAAKPKQPARLPVAKAQPAPNAGAAPAPQNLSSSILQRSQSLRRVEQQAEAKKPAAAEADNPLLRSFLGAMNGRNLDFNDSSKGNDFEQDWEDSESATLARRVVRPASSAATAAAPQPQASAEQPAAPSVPADAARTEDASANGSSSPQAAPRTGGLLSYFWNKK